jgi:hypothetical protein
VKTREGLALSDSMLQPSTAKLVLRPGPLNHAFCHRIALPNASAVNVDQLPEFGSAGVRGLKEQWRKRAAESSFAIEAQDLAFSSLSLAVSSTISTVPLKAEINQESR